MSFRISGPGCLLLSASFSSSLRRRQPALRQLRRPRGHRRGFALGRARASGEDPHHWIEIFVIGASKHWREAEVVIVQVLGGKPAPERFVYRFSGPPGLVRGRAAQCAKKNPLATGRCSFRGPCAAPLLRFTDTELHGHRPWTPLRKEIRRRLPGQGFHPLRGPLKRLGAAGLGGGSASWFRRPRPGGRGRRPVRRR